MNNQPCQLCGDKAETVMNGKIRCSNKKCLLNKTAFYPNDWNPEDARTVTVNAVIKLFSKDAHEKPIDISYVASYPANSSLVDILAKALKDRPLPEPIFTEQGKFHTLIIRMNNVDWEFRGEYCK